MKIFDAECAAGVVMVNFIPVLNCQILGNGIGASNGYVVIADEKVVYLPKTSEDTKSLISIMESLCNAISSLTVTTTLSGSPTSPPLNTASFIALKTELILLKNTLK